MDIRIRQAGTGDMDAFIAFTRAVRGAMPCPEWFYLDPDEEVRAMMERGIMKLWLAEDGERLAGAFNILTPGLEPFNLGYDLGFEDARLRRVVHMETAAVHPDYRGRKLQRRLMEAAERELARLEGPILLCTVHPDNRYSLQNVLNQGYTIEKKLAKYGSVRYLLRKDL